MNLKFFLCSLVSRLRKLKGTTCHRVLGSLMLVVKMVVDISCENLKFVKLIVTATALVSRI